MHRVIWAAAAVASTAAAFSKWQRSDSLNPTASRQLHQPSLALRSQLLMAAAASPSPSLSPPTESPASRRARHRIAPLLHEARRRLLHGNGVGDADSLDVDAILAPLRNALAEARTRDGLSDEELHRLSAGAHSTAAADCLATGRLAAAERLLRAELQDLLLSGLTVRDPAVVETSVRLGNLLLSNGNIEAGLAGLEFAVDGAAAGLAEFAAREADSLRLVQLMAELGSQAVRNAAEAARLRKLEAELRERRALLGLAQSNLAKALLHFHPPPKTASADKAGNRALDLLRSALGFARQAYGGSAGHENVACLLNDIGAVLSRLGRQDEAIESLEAALQSAERQQLTPLTCAILCNLGEARARRGGADLTAAARSCQRATELAKKLRKSAGAAGDQAEDLELRAHCCMALVERLLETRQAV